MTLMKVALKFVCVLLLLPTGGANRIEGSVNEQRVMQGVSEQAANAQAASADVASAKAVSAAKLADDTKSTAMKEAAKADLGADLQKMTAEQASADDSDAVATQDTSRADAATTMDDKASAEDSDAVASAQNTSRADVATTMDDEDTWGNRVCADKTFDTWGNSCLASENCDWFAVDEGTLEVLKMDFEGETLTEVQQKILADIGSLKDGKTKEDNPLLLLDVLFVYDGLFASDCGYKNGDKNKYASDNACETYAKKGFCLAKSNERDGKSKRLYYALGSGKRCHKTQNCETEMNCLCMEKGKVCNKCNVDASGTVKTGCKCQNFIRQVGLDIEVATNFLSAAKERVEDKRRSMFKNLFAELRGKGNYLPDA